jgi:hypothetical protein
MRDKTPVVREWPLRVKASLLACTIFTALLIIDMTMGPEGKNVPELIRMALTVARLPVNFTRFLFNFCYSG